MGIPSLQTTAGVDIYFYSATGTSPAKSTEGSLWSMSLLVEGTGAVTATGNIETSNTPDVENSWVVLAEFSASGTTFAIDTVTTKSAWAYNRFKLLTLTGTGAKAEFSCSTKS